jgi:hypothetical protein
LFPFRLSIAYNFSFLVLLQESHILRLHMNYTHPTGPATLGI